MIDLRVLRELGFRCRDSDGGELICWRPGMSDTKLILRLREPWPRIEVLKVGTYVVETIPDTDDSGHAEENIVNGAKIWELEKEVGKALGTELENCGDAFLSSHREVKLRAGLVFTFALSPQNLAKAIALYSALSRVRLEGGARPFMIEWRIVDRSGNEVPIDELVDAIRREYRKVVRMAWISERGREPPALEL